MYKVTCLVALAAGCAAGDDAAETGELAQAATGTCSAVRLSSPAKNDSIVGRVGEPLALAASATCEAGVVPETQFRVRPAGSKVWMPLPGTTSPASWTPPSAGRWYVLAAVRASGASAWDALSIQVTFNVVGNQLPVAEEDSATVQKNGASTTDLTANDRDLDGDPLTVTITQPAHGTASLAGSAVTYIPAFDYVGSDVIDYTIDDGHGGTASAKLTVSVAAPTGSCAVSASPASSTVAPNAAIALSASATCDGPEIEYQWYRRGDAGSVEIVRPWSAVATYDVPTTVLGTVGYFALARTATAQGRSADATVTVSESAAKCASPKLTTPTRTTVGVAGSAMTLNAVPNCPAGSTPEIQFRVRKFPSTTWINLPGLASSTSWSPASAGEWYVLAASRTEGSTTWHANSLQVRFNVIDGNHAPNANDDAASTSEDTPVAIALGANDSDPDGDSLAFAIQSSPAHGALDASDPANPVYTPDANYAGPDGFTYAISDGRGGSDSATVSIAVQGVNDAPVVNDDSLATQEDQPASIDVTANDRDVDGTLAISSASDGSHGTVTFSGGTATYTPAANYSGGDQFTVTVSDGSSLASSTVFVTVSAVADAPVARDDATAVDEDSGVWIGVLTNDSDDDGEALSIDSVGSAAHGAVTFSGDQVHYAPEANFHGSDSFTYTMSDSSGATSVATVVVAVSAVNDAPVADADEATLDEDGSITIDVVANDRDADGEHLAITSTSSASNGSVSVADNKLVYTPAANFHGSDAFSYTVEDAEGSFASALVSVTVGSVNDAPVASDQSSVIASSKSLTLVATDLENDALTYSIVDGPSHGTLSNASGPAIVYTREPGYTGDDSFTFKANDGVADSNVATVSISVVEPSVGAYIEAGRYHTCSVRTDATLWCWGYGSNGQLGNGSYEQRAIATQVGTEAVWSTVATGSYHTCATKLDGTLWCWGYNGYGQTTSTGDSSVPFQIEGEYSAVAAGYMHTCATRSDGTLWCWGRNSEGQLGNANGGQVGDASDWATIAAGLYQTCATKTDGTLWCWGANWVGQSGLGTGVHMTSTPTQVDTETTWTSVEADGDHTCALRSDESLWCFGQNGNGELGDGSNESKWTPVRVGDESTAWASLGLGWNHSCATRTDDSLWCWGYNYHGTLGDGTAVTRNVPGQVGTDSTWSAVTGGQFHSCGVNAGQIMCWGHNGQDQLGIATTRTERKPKAVAGGPVVDASAGSEHTCSIRADGTLWCWGYNGNGQLGTGNTSESQPPQQVGTSRWSSVSTDSSHTCAIKDDGSLWCWGHGGSGELGNGTGATSYTPAEVASGATWQSVESGSNHTCAIKSDGTLWCWGYNGSGQLGDGSYNTQYSPIQIGTATWSSISARSNHTCAIQTDQSLWCWGYNHYGQIGNGTSYDNQPTPVQVAGSWSSVGVGDLHTCATQSDGSLWCWGYNGNGQIGNGSTSDLVATPSRVGTETNWIEAGAGYHHSCALNSSDQLACWGYGWEGQLGNGGRENHTAPVVIGGSWTALAVGGHFTCGVRDDQMLACWGYNYYGQVANPGGAGTHVPMPVIDAPAGLVSYYTGEHHANDTVGGRHGVLSGDASYTYGVRNNGFKFDGMGQVTAPATGLPSGSANRTIMAWVRIDAAVATEAFFAGYGSFSSNASFSIGAGTDLAPHFSASAGNLAGGRMVLENWHHVAVTSTGSTVTLVLDGVQVATGTHALATAADQSLLLGMVDGDHRLQGAMDEVRIYDRALTVEQIALIYSADD